MAWWIGFAAAVVRILVELVVVVDWAEVVVAIVDGAGGSTVGWGGVWCTAMVLVP